MAKEVGVAKLFTTGRSQAVRLPKEFRFEGQQVRIRRVEGGVLLEPMSSDVRNLFKRIDAIDSDFMPEGRQQPLAPVEDLFP